MIKTKIRYFFEARELEVLFIPQIQSMCGMTELFYEMTLK